MPSVAFDEGLLRSMSDYIVAVNRLKHAEGRAVDGLADPAALRVLAATEQDAERACVQALLQRGWQPPAMAVLTAPVVLARGA